MRIKLRAEVVQQNYDGTIEVELNSAPIPPEHYAIFRQYVPRLMSDFEELLVEEAVLDAVQFSSLEPTLPPSPLYQQSLAANKKAMGKRVNNTEDKMELDDERRYS